MAQSHAGNKTAIALVLDVDGSLLKTDMLFESFWAALGRHPWLCLISVFTLIFNRPALKKRMAELAGLNISLLPLRKEIVTLAEDAKEAGRTVILASGSNEVLVQALSDRLGLVEPAMASNGQINLTRGTKAKALEARFGKRGFEYVGDSEADIKVWQAGVGGYIIAPTAKLLRQVSKPQLTLTPIGQRDEGWALLRALRPHQWVKNILLLLPIVAAHRTDIEGFALAIWGIVVFSAAASSIYIVNDLMDLEADRKHATKKHRPFAAGTASIQSGMLTSAALAIGALGGAAAHSWQLAAIIALYMVLSLSYSMGLKRLSWVDISTLAALYTLRVVAGAIVAGVPMSGWLGAFVFPVFLSLGAVKRLIELGKAENEEVLPGRGYARRDRADLRNIAITAAIGAVVVYTLYTYSEIAAVLYQNLTELRLAAVPVAAWLGRMIYRGWQGRMDYDPIVFALRDPIGLTLMAIGAGLLVHSAV